MTLIVKIANFILRAYVFMKIWNWFPATLFGVASLNLAGSIGLLMLLLFAKQMDFPTKYEVQEKHKHMDESERVSWKFYPTIAYLLILLIGWIAKLCM